MKTNYQMLRDLDGFHPGERGFISSDEITLVKNVLCLDEMDELQLRNLRDFTVLLYTNKMEKCFSLKDYDQELALSDKMSALVAVIDQALFSKGYDV